jgi:DNA-binding NarL/FixJ family response regulator
MASHLTLAPATNGRAWHGPTSHDRRRITPRIDAINGPTATAQSKIGTSSLTEREFAVLEAFADGLRSHEIAEALNVDVKTYRELCGRIRTKLGARSDVHAVSIGFRTGLLELDRRNVHDFDKRRANHCGD